MKHAMRFPPPHARRVARPFCPKCDDMLFAPEVSQHVNENLVQHVWSCESCGYIFKTSVILEHPEANAARPAAA